MSHAVATPPPSTPTTKLNPNWIRTTFASVMLAILLRVGLGVPILTTLVTVGMIFLTHILFTEMTTGVKMVWTGMKLTANMAMGIVIFLAIRFLVGGVIGLYPIDTYGTINNSGGLYGLLPGRETPRVILFEICFAFVAGGLSVAWAQQKQRKVIGTIFVVSLIVLGTQIALPNYASTWADRDEVSTNLINDGVLGATFKGTRVLLFGKPKPTPAPTYSASPVVSSSSSSITQLPDHYTPCSIKIREIRDLYTDGEPVFALPPRWPKDKAVRYSGRGHLTLEGSNIHAGEWEFWSANDPNKVVLIRVFGK